MKPLPSRWTGAGALVSGAVLALGIRATLAADDKNAASTPAKAALTVNVVRPQPTLLPVRINANGNIAAWQEASIGTEANGLRLADVKVNVGDVVRRGQVLATFAPDTMRAEVAQIRAAVAEAEAVLADASANAQRARGLRETGALSEAAINTYQTAERTAMARLDAQRAAAQTQQLRLRQTEVLAPDAGVISARSATVGAVLPAGQELFRMIRQGRLEWRAEVAASDMASIRPGMSARVTSGNGAGVQGKVRMVAPTVDPQTRNGLVYVDLPATGAAATAGNGMRAGMFARGEFEVGSGTALTLPQSAVLLRDGFSYVLRVDAPSQGNARPPQVGLTPSAGGRREVADSGLAKVSQVKVGVGRRMGERIEITGGLDANASVVASGGGFLADGDTVRVVDAAAPKPASAAPAAPAATSTPAAPAATNTRAAPLVANTPSTPTAPAAR